MSGDIKENANPSEVFWGFMNAIKNRDGEASWNMLSQATQEIFAAMFSIVGGFADGFMDGAKEITGAPVPKEGCEPMPELSDGKTMWVTLIVEGKEESKPGFALQDVTINSEEVEEKEAHLLLVDKEGKEQKVDLVKEGGAWKLVLAGPGGN